MKEEGLLKVVRMLKSTIIMSKVDKEFKPSVWAISKSNIIYFLMFIFLAFGINA